MKSINQRKKRIAFPTINGSELYNRNEIVYIKAENSQCSVFISGKETPLVVNKSLKECEAELKDDDFVRIHRSYLINYDHLKKYIKGNGGVALMSNKHELDVSKDGKELLVKKMEWWDGDEEDSTPDSAYSQPQKEDSQVDA